MALGEPRISSNDMQTGAFKEPFASNEWAQITKTACETAPRSFQESPYRWERWGLEGVGPVRCWQIPANSKSSPSLPKRLLNLSCDQLLAQKRGGSGLI